MDTPGLADIEIKKEASEAITGALKEGGVYKIFFVITLEAGRVRPEDKVTMDTVLKSAPITHYGVIINKVSKKEREQLIDNVDGAYDQVVAGLMSGSPTQSLYFHFNMHMEKIEGEDDAIMPLDDEMRSFIVNVPPIMIKPEEVQTIATDNFKAMTEKIENKLSSLRKDKKLLEEEKEKNRATQELMLVDMQMRNDQLMQKYVEGQLQAATKPSKGWLDGVVSVVKAAAPLIPTLLMAKHMQEQQIGMQAQMNDQARIMMDRLSKAEAERAQTQDMLNKLMLMQAKAAEQPKAPAAPAGGDIGGKIQMAMGIGKFAMPFITPMLGALPALLR
jgi:hypothetical protein